ncbi:protein GLUTAMINE DUMPER 5-like [Mangifera indica]|uniref:protein GLUTAMINE DUMPER 5-like n=1 Tax=Mangifera indica TaxID=29780 RepID=UPI001CF9C1F6|nr:protein GLUTAMINE DUMPER 5-like [Mangifera indica]
MRTLVKFNTQPMSAAGTTTESEGSFSPPVMVGQQRSPLHSPVPYLFGGLAAMLGLIAFALLILACSYWRFSHRLDSNDDQNGERDLESGEKEQEGSSAKSVKVFEEKILVIMAGNEKPTFLATPVCGKASYFRDGKDMIENKEGEKVETSEKVVKEAMAGEREATILTILNEENSRDNLESQQDQEQNQ